MLLRAGSNLLFTLGAIVLFALTRESAGLLQELGKLSPYVDPNMSDMILKLLASSIFYGVICAVLASIGWWLQYRRLRKYRGAVTIRPLTAYRENEAVPPAPPA
jgi:hypothetical protein